ncbi:hypothetical protein DPEC_G00099190 [Dallia pectoralis]|uniref:Uncharacterized protein n=1 Tax=Dallia pectoralis TaxID=75939 RepID=A0ACC2GWN3_DALPE|nr:hypothetical protein DPEC_G00099190 [Dallia pectoralis]
MGSSVGPRPDTGERAWREVRGKMVNVAQAYGETRSPPSESSSSPAVFAALIPNPSPSAPLRRTQRLPPPAAILVCSPRLW